MTPEARFIAPHPQYTPYRAQSCVSIHPGKEENTTKGAGSGPDPMPARRTPIKPRETVSNLSKPITYTPEHAQRKNVANEIQ